MYTIGIGPSSSHTVGPMKAAFAFCQSMAKQLSEVDRLQVYLHGSLAHTGVGHGTNHAILLGLSGYLPDQVDPDQALAVVDQVLQSHQLNLLGQHVISFTIGDDLCFDFVHLLPEHSNGMRFVAYRKDGSVLAEEVMYSIGGGFIYRPEHDDPEGPMGDNFNVPYPFTNSAQLLKCCEQTGLSIAGIQLANEREQRSDEEINAYLDLLVTTMERCMDRGCHTEGLLNGKLRVKRRAPELYQKLLRQGNGQSESSNMLNWVNVFAMAVNEENAAGGRVVTAPTNGAAGIIPAVLAYYRRFHNDNTPKSAHKYLLTAAAIGSLFKMNASISGAEMGCQGEVGVACSMAAAALAAVFGGTPKQVEQAAEIGIEHNLGLTCDPVDGLVQIPCIERNAMGAMKAINAAHIAMAESGDHKITLDMAINSMREIGENMNAIYKETSKGGLAVAVNVIEC